MVCSIKFVLNFHIVIDTTFLGHMLHDSAILCLKHINYYQVVSLHLFLSEYNYQRLPLV